MFDEDSEEEESEQISEEDSESDELSNSQIKALSLCEEKNASWTDSAGNSFTWISPNFVKGFNKIFSGVLVNKRVFKIGDTVFISSPRDSPQYIGLIVGLYQTPFNQRRVELQWFYYVNDLLDAKISINSKSRNSKKELFLSTVVDSNDVAVLDRHCIVKPTKELGGRKDAKAWAQAAVGRFFWSFYYDSSTSEFTKDPPVRKERGRAKSNSE